MLEAPQDGWVQTFPDLDFYAVTLAAGEIVEGLDFGNEQVGSIHGQKWNDLNGDGVHDPDEPGLNGWTIQLVDLEAGQDVEDTQITHDMDLNNDGVIDPVTERGLYWFKDLLPGEYDVLEVPQDGWVQTFPDLVFHAATLAVGDIVEGLDFGNEQVGSIHGQKWNDLNGDGVHDPDEPGLNGWTIQLVDLEAGGDVEDTQITHDMDLNNDGVIDPVTERGLYWFVDLLEGEYDVLEVPQDGWVQTFPDLVFHAVTLAVGDIVEGLDFGNYQPGEQFLSLEPGEAFNLAGGSHTVSAFVTNEVLIPVPGVEVFFEVVAGPNTGASGSAITDVNGEARFTYTDLAATGGTDQIQASAGPNILGQIVFKTWTWILELQPASATNPVGTSHTVTAILTGEGGVGAPNGVPVNFEVLSGPNAGVSGTVVTGGLIGFADFTYTDTAAQSGDTDEIGAWIGASPTFAGASVLDSAIVTKTWVAETGKTTVEGVEAILKVQSDEFSSHVEISIELVSLDLTSPHPLDGQITAFEVFMGGAPVSPPIDFFDGALVTGQLALESYLPEPGDPLPDQSAMIHLLDAQENNLGLVPVTVPDQTVFADILDDFVELFDSEFILISILDAPLGQVVLLDICNFSSGDKEFMVFDPSGNPIAGPILLLPSFPDECTRVLILVDLPGTCTLEVFDVATGLPVFIGPFIAGVL